jgi:ribosomal small subunit protein bTHX
MGKGDKRTKKGKRTIGSNGVTRASKPAAKVIVAKPKKKAAPKKAAAAKTETVAKKPAAAKKAPAKKAAAKK